MTDRSNPVRSAESVEEYLRLEAELNDRFEFVDGWMFGKSRRFSAARPNRIAAGR